MTKKLKVFLAIIPFSLTAVTLSVASLSGKYFIKSAAASTTYQLTLNSGNKLSGLTSSYQKSVFGTVTTAFGNEITITATTAKSLSSGYVQLGNYGTVYCVTSDAKHISGLTKIKVNYSGGSLKLKSSSVDSTDGSSFITETNSLTSGTEKSLSTAANSFVLEAGEASVSITQIQLTYTCSSSNTSFDYSQTYNVEDFESYTADGVGYDSSHSMDATTNLRSAFYSTYYGGETNALSGANWTIMGSTDYLTYNGTKGRNNSKCALFKVNAGNNFHYVQAKHYFGVPTAIGKGYKLSVWLRGGYSDKSMSTESGYNTKVTLIAYYNKALNTSGTNSAAIATYTVLANSGWGEYTIDLDSSKTVYAFGIYLPKASGQIYLPMDDVKLYTSFPFNTNWPVGCYKTDVSVYGNSIPVTFAFSDQRKAVAVRFANNTDPNVTDYSYDTSTKEFTITTTGSYLSYSFGTITGKWEPANNRVINVGLSGSIKNLINNNGSLTFPATSKYWNCDGTTAELQTIFKRRYGGTVDTINADKIVSAPYLRCSGTNSLKFRLWDSGLAQLNLQNDISVSCANIGFWVYSSLSEEKNIRLFYYTGAGLTDYAEIGAVAAKPKQWTWVCMGFGKTVTLKNFQISFDQWNYSETVLVDDICLYTS